MEGCFGERMVFWAIAYLFLAALALGRSALLALQTWEHRRYARSCMRGLRRHRPSGRAAVFAPCKGIDVELEGNLRALLRQDYEDFEVTFAVESGDDPACAVIRRVMAEHPWVATRLVVAGRALASGQKVHNLRSATAWLSSEIEYLAFVDSDARPRPEWLRLLVTRLGRRGTAAVTGYRWFIPIRDSAANHLLYSVNCDVMSLLGRSSHHLIWGGSWGIRRNVFDTIGLRPAWEGTLSDDLVASRQLRRARLPVRFEPACVVASPMDYSLRETISFLRRQYLMGRFYLQDWWLLAFTAAAVINLAWLGTLGALGWALAVRSPLALVPGAVGLVLYLLSVGRGWLRQDLTRTYFPDRQEAFRQARLYDIWAGPLAGMLNWLGVLGSLFGRHITWRGVRYRVFPGGQIRVVRHEGQPRAPQTAEQPADTLPGLPWRRLAPYRKAG